MSEAHPIVVPPLSTEQEDHIILARITNDERPLRRVIKKFHNYTSLAYDPIAPQVVLSGNASSTSVNDAREAFLVELASFQLTLKKSTMICEAEARQVEEYHRERQRIDDEHGTLIAQIEELKVALEHAQILRRRKIEYDLVSEKVNTLPTREELEQSIQALENDMQAIRSEHETLNRTVLSHKLALDEIVGQLTALRVVNKDQDVTTDSARATPNPERSDSPSIDETRENTTAPSTDPALVEEIEEGEEEEEKEIIPEADASEADIEMGEVEEDPRDKSGKKLREDLEEGEATDASSELSEPPDDDDDD